MIEAPTTVGQLMIGDPLQGRGHRRLTRVAAAAPTPVRGSSLGAAATVVARSGVAADILHQVVARSRLLAKIHQFDGDGGLVDVVGNDHFRDVLRDGLRDHIDRQCRIGHHRIDVHRRRQLLLELLDLLQVLTRRGSDNGFDLLRRCRRP